MLKFMLERLTKNCLVCTLREINLLIFRLSDVAVYDGISRLSKVKKNEASSEDREPLMREEYD